MSLPILFPPKKSLGQHFLHDSATAQRIAMLLTDTECYAAVVEVGAGSGALTQWLVGHVQAPLYLVELDRKLADYLEKTYSSEHVRVVCADVLALPLHDITEGRMAVVGNFPYHISSQIFFKVLQAREQVDQVVGMVQHEVAERLSAKPGSRIYGLLSVLLQAFYEVTYCFSVPPEVFTPPPKVTSAVLRLTRNAVTQLPCDEELFVKVVKAAFQQRRKMLRNALSVLGYDLSYLPVSLLKKRAEALGVEDFVLITQQLTDKMMKKKGVLRL